MFFFLQIYSLTNVLMWHKFTVEIFSSQLLNENWMFKWLMLAVKWMVSEKRKIAMSTNNTRVVKSERKKTRKISSHFFQCWASSTLVCVSAFSKNLSGSFHRCQTVFSHFTSLTYSYSRQMRWVFFLLLHVSWHGQEFLEEWLWAFFLLQKLSFLSLTMRVLTSSQWNQKLVKWGFYLQK